MKKTIMILTVLFANQVLANSDYDFSKKFKLERVEVSKSGILNAGIETSGSFVNPQFLAVPGDVCLESLPAQCYLTLIRVDDSSYDPSVVQYQTEKIDLKKYFGPKDVVVTIIGPNQHLQVQY